MNTEVADESSGKRPWLAALLSFFVPGIGHLYLREWLRSVFWFVTVILAGQLLIPADAVGEELSIEAITRTFDAAPLTAKVTLVGLTFLCMADAYWVAKREPTRSAVSGDGGQTCPSCGKELDENLDFCHWCSTEIPDGDADADAELTAGEVNERAGAFEGDLATGPEGNGDDEEADEQRPK